MGNSITGGTGSALNYFDSEAVKKYLDHFFSMEEDWGESLSNYIRDIFSDSIEIAESNFTPGILESFKKEKGYDLIPFLPYVLMPETHVEKVLKPSQELKDEIRRARYDWNEFHTSVFLDNYVKTFTQYCEEKGLKARLQVAGSPVLMNTYKGYEIPHIPESENWLSRENYLESDPYTMEGWKTHPVECKYAATAAHITGKSIVSTEAMTNVKDLFRASLGELKQALDVNFIKGINHSVVHGCTYSPADVPYPGFVRFGTFMDPSNTWWPYVKLWADYNGRVSTVLQQSKAVGEIAVVAPVEDSWSRFGLSRHQISNNPRYTGNLWKALAEAGLNSDYLHQDALGQAEVVDGMLSYGKMRFPVLLLLEVGSLKPEAAEAIAKFSQAGGKLIFVGRVPSRSPGQVDSEKNDLRVQKAMEAALDAGAIDAKPPSDIGVEPVREWIGEVLEKVNYDQALDIENQVEGFYSLRKKLGTEEVLFFANTRRLTGHQSRVDFAVGDRGFWRWEPHTGKRVPYEQDYDETGFNVDLNPLESLLLVTGEKKEAGSRPLTVASVDRSDAVELQGPWSVEFAPLNKGEKFSIVMDKLTDFTKHDDERLSGFSGLATYKTTFQRPMGAHSALLLGATNDHICEVRLNGEFVGVSWYG